MLRKSILIAGVLMLLFGIGIRADARPPHKKSLADYFGPLLAKNLNDCRTCHLPPKPGEANDALSEEKPHNPFGARMKEVRNELKQAGKKTAIADRLQAVADEDSDGDGVSNLAELLTGHNPGDPNDKPTAAEIADLPKKLAALKEYQKSYHWTPLESVKRPAVPQVKNTVWVRNPIDTFIAAEHEKRSLQPRPPAAKNVLLRRVYFDLIGLPPTRKELHDFLADASPDAYEKVVDRLLADPRYGERWGRHWMDVWRYSDWYGFGAEIRNSQRHMWRFRDWIIESLNQDKGYDRMVCEMIAGDEIAPTDPNVLRATGFLARNWYSFNRNVWLNDTVEHTAKALLGMTVNCARCHDHMYDPISQKEYYDFRAIFAPHNVRTDRIPGQADILKDGVPRVFDADLKAETYLFVRGNDANPDKSEARRPGVPAAFGGGAFAVEPVNLPLLAYTPDKQDFVVKDNLAAAEQAITLAKNALRIARRDAMSGTAGFISPVPFQGLTALAANLKPLALLAATESDVTLAEAKHRALAAVIRVEQLEDSGKKGTQEWEQAAVFAAYAQAKEKDITAEQALNKAYFAAVTTNPADRKSAAKKLADAIQKVSKKNAVALSTQKIEYEKRKLTAYPATSSGRRLALARWITDKQNPLAARVAMNHIWLRHFGKAIVPTVFDFGQNGQPPSHPALLDWLAAEFVDQNWNMKKMHRLLVTSNAYRMDSTADEKDLALDPDNRFLWRMNPRRLEAEAVRDSVLYVAGQLDAKMGGPEIDRNQGLTNRRRSVYFQHAAEKQMEFLMLFDEANVTECYQRPVSIVPQQALALANSSLAQAEARLLARRLTQEVGGSPSATAGFIIAGFEQILSRPPTAKEHLECELFLEEQTALLRNKPKLNAFAAGPANPVKPADDPALRAREDLIQVLLNHNEFVTIR